MAVDKRVQDFKNALDRLQESWQKANAYRECEEYSFYRDSTIQRFEFTLEIAWKNVKHFLLKQEGIACRSPKSCMREFFGAGYLDEAQIALLLQMIDDRNLATHTYHEALADEIFSHIERYLILLEDIYKIVCSSRYSD